MATKTVNKTSKPKYETFECVYTSGLLIEPSFLTALSLIFDKIYILNNIEFVIEFSKHYTFNAYFGEIGHLFGLKTAGCPGKSATPIL
jgi:hypothetical protein